MALRYFRVLSIVTASHAMKRQTVPSTSTAGHRCPCETGASRWLWGAWAARPARLRALRGEAVCSLGPLQAPPWLFLMGSSASPSCLLFHPSCGICCWAPGRGGGASWYFDSASGVFINELRKNGSRGIHASLRTRLDVALGVAATLVARGSVAPHPGPGVSPSAGLRGGPWCGSGRLAPTQCWGSLAGGPTFHRPP